MKAGSKLTAAVLAAVMASSVLPAAVSADTVNSAASVSSSASADVHLSRRSLELEEGSTSNIRLVGATGTISWRIGNPKVFTYSKGKITAVGEGSAYLYATYGGKEYKCLITVNKKLTGISANASEISLKKGESKQLIVSDGGKQVSVHIYNSDVCTAACGVIVDHKFPLIIKGKKNGESTVTVFDVNNPKNSYAIKVNVGNKSSAGNAVKENTLEVEEYAKEIVRRVNEERESIGLKPLVMDDSLCKSADIRAKEVAVKFAHERPDNTGFFTVIQEGGYAGENIGMGYTTPDEAMKGWMTSPGHMANILDPKFTKIGVAYNDDLGTWVEEFLN